MSLLVAEHDTTSEPLPPAPTPPLPVEDRRTVWKSEDLLAGQCEAIIIHQGQTYRLRCTKHGKLILYK